MAIVCNLHQNCLDPPLSETSGNSDEFDRNFHCNLCRNWNLFLWNPEETTSKSCGIFVVIVCNLHLNYLKPARLETLGYSEKIELNFRSNLAESPTKSSGVFFVGNSVKLFGISAKIIWILLCTNHQETLSKSSILVVVCLESLSISSRSSSVGIVWNRRERQQTLRDNSVE